MIRIETIEVIHCICDRPSCGHEWSPRKGSTRKICPRCKNLNWNSSGIVERITLEEAEKRKVDPPYIAKRRIEMNEFHLGPRSGNVIR